MHPLFVPPEAREPTSKGWSWSVEGVAMPSLLLVTVSATACVGFELAPIVAPGTALVAYGFWRVGRRITRRSRMWLWCLGGGAVAGVLNAWLAVALWVILDRGEPIGLNVNTLVNAGMFGAMVGFAYGIAYLLPMLTQLVARSLRRTEGIDRCLVGYGLWGVLVLPLAFHLARPQVGAEREMDEVVFLIAAATLALHGLMALGGTLRWARRRWWLGRALRGKVDDWRVCDSQRFHAAELEGLQVFCSPVFARPPADKDDLWVLAWADPTNAYRAMPLTPKYLVAQEPRGNR